MLRNTCGSCSRNEQCELGAGQRHQRGRDPEPDRLTLFALARCNLFSSLLDEVQDRERAGVQQAAGLGRLTPREWRTKRAMPRSSSICLILHAQCSLRNVKLLGGARHIAGLHHADEILKLPQVHCLLLAKSNNLALPATIAHGQFSSNSELGLWSRSTKSAVGQAVADLTIEPPRGPVRTQFRQS